MATSGNEYSSLGPHGVPMPAFGNRDFSGKADESASVPEDIDPDSDNLRLVRVKFGDAI